MAGSGGQTITAVESCFSIVKRGMKGVYQHCAEKHLQRYLTEFDVRYNNRTKLGFSDMSARLKRCAARKANAYSTGNLIKPDFSFEAKRFLRWRKKQKKEKASPLVRQARLSVA